MDDGGRGEGEGITGKGKDICGIYVKALRWKLVHFRSWKTGHGGNQEETEEKNNTMYDFR